MNLTDSIIIIFQILYRYHDSNEHLTLHNKHLMKIWYHDSTTCISH